MAGQAIRSGGERLAPGIAIRWLGLTLLLAGELLAITTWLDTGTLVHRPGLLAVALGYSPVLLNIALAFLGALLLIVGPRLPARIAGLGSRSRDHRWLRWLVLHLAALGGFLLLSREIFDAATGLPPTGLASATGWLALALATFLLWLSAIAPWPAWRWLMAEERPAFMGSAAVAVGVWLAGQATQVLWRPLADATFWVSKQQLALLYPDVVADASRRILGTPAFRVEIAPSCSGYEGIGLIVAFVGVYLWLFRQHLRFPQALLLLPIGAAIVWLFNTVRITALISIGSSWSPQMAAGGFHSQAGWISFIAVALLVVAATHRAGLFGRDGDAAPAPAHALLASALLMPFVVLMLASIVTTAFAPGFDAWYPLKVLLAAGALWYFRSVYRQLAWGWSWESVAIGTGVFALWILLEPAPESPPALRVELAGLPAWVAALWLAFRIVGSVVIVPLVEELAFRGYLLRKLAARNFEEVDPGRFAPFAFLASSLLFGLLHGRWLAGTLAGMAYALAVYRRGRIGDAVAAHGTTNGLIALWVLSLGEWSLWI
jgi:exosortase E/protease (VPEID-CTERM system)